MNPLMKLVPVLEDYFKKLTVTMVKDLEFFIERESSNPDLRMFHFIHSGAHDGFDPVVRSLNRWGETITDVVSLPIKNRENLYSLDNYQCLIPFELLEEEDEIYEFHLNLNDSAKMEEYNQFEHEYFEAKTLVFKEWFMQCWKEACKNTGSNIQTSLSIHEDFGGLDLMTGKYMEEDEVDAFFEIPPQNERNEESQEATKFQQKGNLSKQPEKIPWWKFW